MNQYKGIIFDLDGTLLNTIEDLGNSANEVLNHYGCPLHNLEEYKQLVGHGMRNLITMSFPAELRNTLNIDEALQKFLKVYDEKYMETTVPYPGIVTMLKELEMKGVKMAVNSNKRDDYTNSLVRKFFNNVPLTGVLGERLGIPRKPDPLSALELADSMGLAPAEILYAGDSGTDMQTGKNAGMDTVGVLWGFRGIVELEENKARYLMESPQQICELF